jgi:hypothetical protein
MHNAYETAAKKEGWKTQKRSRVTWDDLPETNKATMRIAVGALIDFLSERLMHHSQKEISGIDFAIAELGDSDNAKEG